MNEFVGQKRRLRGRGTVDYTRPLSFVFDGKRYTGFAGDTLASALLSNGVTLVGRSFKYHRPRGILTSGSDEPNALVGLREDARHEANTRATMVELYDGLVAESQNRWPSLAVDIGSINSLFAPIFVAGFYYKTFKWPASFWERVYEPIIRRAAGLGRAPTAPDPDSYRQKNVFCDVLVVGGGIAGISAALAAAGAGAGVVIADEHSILGGELLADNEDVDGIPASEWLRKSVAALNASVNITVLSRTTVFGAYDQHTYGAVERVCDHLREPGKNRPRQRLWKIVARQTVLAAGALEQPLVFGGNDRPGVMLAGAVRMYLNHFGVLAGSKPAVVTANDSGWKLVRDLIDAGAPPVAIVDLRDQVGNEWHTLAEQCGIPLFVGGRVARTHGGRRVTGMTIVDSRGTRRMPCDLIAMAGGWNPCVALATHLGGKPKWNEALGVFVEPDLLPPGMIVAGAARARFDADSARVDGHCAGVTAADIVAGREVRKSDIDDLAPEPLAARNAALGTSTLARVENRNALLSNAYGSEKAFVDFQHDVTSEDVALAHREGFRSVEHLKRYTTLGMATDQGKLSNINGLALMAACKNQAVGEAGTTLSRPPYTPVAFGPLAGLERGSHYKPTRYSPGHRWAESAGATFMLAGAWQRPKWFARPDESDWLVTVNREVNAVRNGVGVCDVSTLGKIDIQGTDAALLLDRVYVNMFSTLPVGKARYGLMLREDGIALDDGTTARIEDSHYVMSTTTANAARVMQHLEYCRQIIWPELDVQLTSITDQWAQYAVAGPKSRVLLEALFQSAFDLSDESLPYMGCAEFKWRGLTIRLFRLSFSGERAYELAVPARYGDAVLQALFEVGKAYDVTPYGIEAMSVMRIEKGHVAASELNGNTTATDLGLGRMVSRKKDFIGSVLSKRAGLTDPARAAIVGLRPVKPDRKFRSGSHLLPIGSAPTMENDLGYVTSTAYSPQLGHQIGLALLSGGLSRVGERLRTFDAVRGSEIEVQVCSPVFIDPDGARLHV
ncbi:sarcosine oxidase subunit alpha family protein [Paraburkholderia phytofirmans]